MKINMQWIQQKHFESILRIENEVFTHPWTLQELRSTLQKRNCVGSIAEAFSDDGKSLGIVGYIISELFEKHYFIRSMAVSPLVQRQGVGKEMLSRMIDRLDYSRRLRIELLVRETNTPAQCFFRSMGFQAYHVLKNHYDDVVEDAYAMKFELPKFANSVS